MKKLFTFKNLLGVIFIIVLIIVPLVTKDKETINIFYFFVGIIFIMMFYRSKDDSNSFLIHLFEQKEKQIDINQKEIKIMNRECNNLRDEIFSLKNMPQITIDNVQLELAQQYLKKRSINPRDEGTFQLLQQQHLVVSQNDVNGVIEMLKNGEFMSFHAKFKEGGHPDFQ